MAEAIDVAIVSPLAAAVADPLNDKLVKMLQCKGKLVCFALPHFHQRLVEWLILPVVICLSQRLSHACLSIAGNSEAANSSLQQPLFLGSTLYLDNW